VQFGVAEMGQNCKTVTFRRQFLSAMHRIESQRL
jgi:hypothetical protein